jgi:hypothetical protein
MDYDKYPPLTLVGMAGLVIALAGGYYLVKHIDCKFPTKRGNPNITLDNTESKENKEK